MLKLKKSLACLVAMLLVLGMVACSKSGDSSKVSSSSAKNASEQKKTVTVTTSFLADLVKQLAQDKVNIELLIPAGGDPHLYTPKPEDKTKLKNGDLVLYHGLHFEGKMVELLEKVGVAVSENFPKDKIGYMDEDGQQVVDPHFWFDISLYKLAAQTVATNLEKLLPEDKEIASNLEQYLQKLDDLDKYVREQIAQIPEQSRILITPHDAFNYFARSYNLKVHAPQGVSTDSEVSTQNVLETVDLIVKNKVKAIFTESTTDPKRMDKLRQDCKSKGFEVKVVTGEDNELFSDSLAPEGHPGDNYIDMYRHNIDLIVNNLK